MRHRKQGARRSSWLNTARPTVRLRSLLPHLILLVAVGAWMVMSAQLTRWPSGDGPHVLGTGLRLSQLIFDGEWYLALLCFSSLLAPHPPGAYLPGTLGYIVSGGAGWGHLLGGGIVLYACLDGIRRLGGMWGCVWLGATGLVWVQAESGGVDLIAAAAVVQSLSHLAASDRLRKPGPTALWGAWMGLAFVTKYTAPMFLWGPCLLAGWWVVRRGRWRALLLALLAFALVATPWWSGHYQNVIGYVQTSNTASTGMWDNQAVANPWSAEEVRWYPAAAVDAFGWPGALALLAGLLIPWRRRGSPRGAWGIPLLAVAGGFLLLNSQSQRQDRYLLPAVPLAAAAAGSAPLSFALAGIGAVGLYGAGVVSLMEPEPPTNRDYAHDFETAGQTWPWTHESYRPTSQDPRPWKMAESLQKVRAQHGSDLGTVGFLLDDRAGAPGAGLILSQAAALGYRWHIATVALPPGGGRPGGPTESIFITPFTIGAWPSREFTTLMAIVRENDRERQAWLASSGLTLVEEWSLPKGRVGRLYTR
ncbi:MAG: hypothetical protein P8R54_22190 [Myxococcota bacterium]|nr:hypothetical protein [Myxococcota bacterium]